MHVLVTGAAGLIGSHSMVALLKEGHTVTATDIAPLPDIVKKQIAQYSVPEYTGDLTDVKFVDQVFETSTYDGIMHIGGIRSPVNLDPRLVHNINVVSTYNVLSTAARKGVKRMVQASSCNALGLSWTMPEHWSLDYVPVDESHPMRPEDPYSLSKLVIEAQAESLCRLFPDIRIASIRMHFTRSSVSETTSAVKHTGLWSWSSVDAVLRACVLGLTSEGWSGAEAFHIAANDIFYPKELSGGVEIPALELVEKHWAGKIKRIDREWWSGNPRRSFFNTAKAQTMLGWRHDL